MKKLVFLFLVFLAIGGRASAQTGSCDTPLIATAQNVSSGSSFSFTACAPNSIISGTTLGWNLTVDGTKTDQGQLTPSGPANAGGDRPFKLTVTNVSKGSHTIGYSYYTLGAANAKQESPAGSPFALNGVDPVPTVAPTAHQLQ